MGAHASTEVPHKSALTLTLVDVSDLVENDESGEKLLRLWRDILSRVGCFTVRATPTDDADDAAAVIERYIASFLKRSDQYLTLVSTLLKSRSFYTAAAFDLKPQVVESALRPIRQLPRTVHGKPYIPGQPHQDVNVSHQYPFVGIAHWRGGSKLAASVGLDIVVFDPHQRHLYASLQEYIDCFRDSLTSIELKNIETVQESRSEDEALREFYITWAIKEAYTKSLGIGLGFNFGTFHVTFEESIGSSVGAGIWMAIATMLESNKNRYIRLQGRVVMQDNVVRNEQTTFYFVPLSRCLKDAVGIQGCACVCLHGRNGEQLDTEWQDIGDLISFHTSCSDS